MGTNKAADKDIFDLILGIFSARDKIVHGSYASRYCVILEKSVLRGRGKARAGPFGAGGTGLGYQFGVRMRRKDFSPWTVLMRTMRVPYTLVLNAWLTLPALPVKVSTVRP